MALQPVEIYGLEVQAGDMAHPALTGEFPATLRITMAAIDPNAPPQLDLAPNTTTTPRATLKLMRLKDDLDDDDEDYEDDEDDDDDAIAAIERRLGGAIGSDDDEEDSDEEEDSEDEDVNGGPSDPAKSKKARKAAAVKQILEALQDENDMEIDGVNGVNGVKGTKADKGKGKALDDDEDSDEDSDDYEGEVEEFVLCTLDPEKHYQQPLDITIGEHERVFFKVTGTHSVYLTGNYVIPPEGPDREDDEDDMEDYDYELGEDDSELDEDEESDELDDLADPRITEVDSDEEEAPKLVKAEKKGKNKRAAADLDEEATGLDAMINDSLKSADAATNGDSKRQSKKLKNNAGQAVAGAEEKPVKKEKKEEQKTPPSAKSDKKVQFAKNLEQGPTGSSSPSVTKKGDAKTESKSADKADGKGKASLGPKKINGVDVDDKKLGTGPAVKQGDKVSLRYIGKLANGKVFDSNKKGKAFSFKLGKGEVIKGMESGVLGLQAGGERRMTIPAHLGYGSKGAPPSIPGNSQLIFDVKLLSIN